jgi:hypothetical protein
MQSIVCAIRVKSVGKEDSETIEGGRNFVIDIPCKCKHMVGDHFKNMGGSFSCQSCIDEFNIDPKWKTKMPSLADVTWVHNYNPDNLTYIEQIAKERNLI